MSKSGIVNVRMVITEEKMLSNIDKVQKLINPKSKKQIIQLDDDTYFKDLIESGKMDINSDGIISFKNSICKYTQTVILTVCVYFSLISNPLTLSHRSTNLNAKNMQICCLFEI